MNNATEQQLAADSIQACYKTLLNKRSNVVWEILKKHETIYQQTHYPPGDICDKVNQCQYYYHSHPSKDNDRIPEHGHFHLFIKAPLLPNSITPIAASKKYKESQGKKDALAHLVAISVNEQGFPMAFFTVNHWVVGGLWYPAKVIIEVLDKFLLDIPSSPFAITNQWVTSMVKLFKPQIADLLNLRDEVIQEWQTAHPKKSVLQDRELEITSINVLSGSNFS